MAPFAAAALDDTPQHPADAVARQRVLLVEDSRSTREMLSAFIRELGDVEVDAVASLREAEPLLAAQPAADYLCAVLELNLPDAPHGEVVDAVRGQGIPIVVIAAAFSESARKTLMRQGVVDCVLKRQPADLRQVASLVRRVRDNPAFRVLVVDGSAVVRDQTAALLQRLSYRTVCAGSGAEALEQWSAHPDICLVITDVNLPVMDGFELIAAIRERASREELPVIGVSDRSRSDLSTRLLKAGANDYLAKPFDVEEFQTRVTQNVDLTGYIRRLKESSRRDAVTDLWNRRHFEDIGEALFRRARRDQGNFAVAMVAVDRLETTGDAHGRPAVDRVLRAVAACVVGLMRPADLVARHAGDTLACVLIGAGPADALLATERLRAQVAALDLRIGDAGLRRPLTVSCGLATGTGTSFAEAVAQAGAALQAARRAGGDRSCTGG